MLKNIVANLIGRLWGSFSNFLFIPLYIHYLGFESYSLISFTLVIAGLMAVLDSGITATLSRELARLDKNDFEKVKIFKTLEKIYFLIVLMSISILYSCSYLIAKHWINLSSFSADEVSFLLKIISFDIGFQLLLRFYMGGMLGIQEQVKANVLQVFWGILRNALVILPLIFISSLEVFFIWQAISSCLFAFIFRISLYKSLNVSRFNSKSGFDLNVLSDVWRFAFGMFLIAIVAAINSQLDKLFISSLLPIEVLGYYTLCVSLALGLVMIISPISTALLPQLTALYSKGENDEASKLFENVVLIVSIIVFSFMFNMAFNSHALIWVWTGDYQLAENSKELLPVILLSYSMLALAVLPFTIAVANGYTKINNILGLFSLLLTLPGYWIGAKLYGALGAAIVYCIAQTLITLIYFYFISDRYMLNNKIFRFYLHKLFSPFVISFVISYAFFYLSPLNYLDRFISFSTLIFYISVTTSLTLMFLAPSFIFRISRSILKKFL